MTVKRWKQVITIFVALLILFLVCITISLNQRYQRDVGKYDEIIEELNLSIGSDELTEEILREAIKLQRISGAAQKHPYQDLYPDLHVENDFIYKENSGKVCYLTFDDGPSTENTEKVLDILKQYDVKATFFVVYKNGEKEKALYKRIVEEGHTIGVHTASHNYTKIYSSVDAYLKDFNQIAEQILQVTGVQPEIFRFPGGSINAYNKEIYMQLISEMLRRGYTYYDWNVSSGDASSALLSTEQIKKNVLDGISEKAINIVLMHDTSVKTTTVEALPVIIENLTEKGYSFDRLTKDVKPLIFGYTS